MNASRVITACMGIAAGLWLQAADAEMHATDEFAAGTTRPVRIALLPARVELVKQKIIRQEAEPEESGELEGYLTAAVAAGLQGKGYEVEIVDPAARGADPQLQELIVEANRRYDELLANVSVRLRKQIETRRYHAGDALTLLADRLGVDAIGFVRMQLVAAAKGVQALNFGMAGSQTMMSISLIDRNTTDIEAYVTLPILRRGKTFAGYDEVIADPGNTMGQYAHATLDDLLGAEPSLRAQTTDEDVLNDLESLLAE
jgi:hypothetical protein